MAFDEYNNLTHIILNNLETIKNKNPASSLLINELKHGRDLDIVYCTKEDNDKLVELFKNYGIAAISGTHKVKEPIAKGEITKPFILFPEKDLSNAKDIIKNFLSQKEYEYISTNELSKSDINIKGIKGINYIQLKLFEEKCKKLGLHTLSKEIENNKYNFYYNDKDSKMIENIKLTSALELNGEAGKALIKQLDYEDNNFARITSRITQTKDDFEVIDLDYHRLSVNSNAVTFYDKNKVYELNRKSPTFNEDICKVMASMKNPVDLSVEEFQKQQFYDKKKKKQFLYKKDREHGRPELTKDEYMAIKKMNENHELYEKKIALENPTQQLYEYSYTNNEMRMATFESFEQTNKEEEKDQVLDENRELEEKDKIFIKEALETARKQEIIEFKTKELNSDIELKTENSENENYDYNRDLEDYER